MPGIVCYEMSDSMSGSITADLEQGEVREVKRRYVIAQCVGFNDAVTKIAPYAPPYVAGDGAGIFWRRTRLDVIGIGNKYFDCTATYSTMMFRQDENGGSGGGGGEGGAVTFQPGSIAWDTTGHTEHITQGLVAEQRLPANAANFQAAINVNGDGVDGVDVVRPAMRYSETWIMPVQTAVGLEYVGNVFRLTGTVNQNQFRAFGQGSALFLGARAQWQGDMPYVAVTFEFEARKNYTSTSGNGLYSVPGIAGTIEKKGWEHVWIAYEPEANNNKLVRKPIALYKNRVYEEADWSPLQLGGAIGTAPTLITAQLPAAPGQGL